MKTIHLTAIIKIEQRRISHLSNRKILGNSPLEQFSFFLKLGNHQNLKRISEILEEVRKLSVPTPVPVLIYLESVKICWRPWVNTLYYRRFLQKIQNKGEHHLFLLFNFLQFSRNPGGMIHYTTVLYCIQFSMLSNADYPFTLLSKTHLSSYMAVRDVTFTMLGVHFLPNNRNQFKTFTLK